MDYIGLLSKFKVNRPLTEDERALQLRQDKHLNVQPRDQLSVIRMNSTFLEMVDKFYAWKGFITLFGLAVLCVCVFILGGSAFIFLRRVGTEISEERSKDIGVLIFVCLVFSPLIIAGVWVFLKENFRYTHYPIRLNRKNGKVYVFRLDGSVLATPWKDIFFTLGKGQMRGWADIRGHLLEADGTTVKETFALSYYSGAQDEDLMQYWEFVRSYMEEGPQRLIDDVKTIMPIAVRRESVMHSFIIYNAVWQGIWPIVLPLTLIVWPFRVLAMRTCKVPHWPDWVETECAVEASDSYQCDEQHPHLATK